MPSIDHVCPLSSPPLPQPQQPSLSLPPIHRGIHPAGRTPRRPEPVSSDRNGVGQILHPSCICMTRHLACTSIRHPSAWHRRDKDQDVSFRCFLSLSAAIPPLQRTPKQRGRGAVEGDQEKGGWQQCGEKERRDRRMQRSSYQCDAVVEARPDRPPFETARSDERSCRAALYADFFSKTWLARLVERWQKSRHVSSTRPHAVRHGGVRVGGDPDSRKRVGGTVASAIGSASRQSKTRMWSGDVVCAAQPLAQEPHTI
jgi:hypothetical protein